MAMMSRRINNILCTNFVSSNNTLLPITSTVAKWCWFQAGHGSHIRQKGHNIDLQPNG
jgi:hypothetical protein